MKNRLGFSFSIIMRILALFFLLFSCKTESENTDDFSANAPTYFMVMFDPSGGSFVPSQSVLKGETAVKPENPTKDGWAFSNWYKGDDIFDFSIPITENVTLKAKWTEIKTDEPEKPENPEEEEPKPVEKAVISFVSQFGEVPSINKDVGTTIAANEIPVLSEYGYSFEGWLNGDEKLEAGYSVTGDVSFTAKWTANKYTITFDANNGTGESSTQIVTFGIISKLEECKFIYLGYRLASWNTQIGSEGTDYSDGGDFAVTEAHDITLYAQWVEADRCIITYANTRGVVNSNPTSYRESVGANLYDLILQGWVFEGWYESLDSDGNGTGTKIASWGAGEKSGDIMLYAKWSPCTDTAYKVEHYKENVDDDNFSLMESDTQNITGMTGGQTSAQAKIYEHYTAQNFEQKTISADGSTVVKIYYKLEMVTMTFNLDGGKIGGKTSVTKSMKYGADFSIETPTKTGWTFSNWIPNLPETAVSGTYTATYTPNENTSYKVEHYKENTEDENFSLVESDTQNLTGMTGGQTSAQAKIYEHYTAQNFEQKTISADGSTVVKIYYKLDTVTMTFNLDGGMIGDKTSVTKTAKYGTSFSIENPTKTGWAFSNWIPNLPETAMAGSYSATYTPNANTVYKVEHYKENVIDDNFSLMESDTQNLTGTTGGQTSAQAKTYEHYTPQNFEQTTIAADGSTVVKIYYSLEKITLTLALDGGTLDGKSGIVKQVGKYGQTVSLGAPERNGYRFEGWNTVGGKLPQIYEENSEFSALWNDPLNKIEITVESKDIAVSKTTYGNSVTFLADEGYSYSWFFEDVEKSNERSCSIDTSNLTKGTYTLVLEAEKGGELYSYYAQIKVTE